MTRGLSWQLTFVTLEAVVLATASLERNSSLMSQPGWAIILVFLVGLGSWFEIPIEPYGHLSLSPVIFLVAATAYGIWDGLVLAALGPVSGWVIQNLIAPKKASILPALAVGGESALSLWLAAVWVGFPITLSGEQLLGLVQLAGGTFLVRFLLRLFQVAHSERVGLHRLVVPLARRALPHIAVMLTAIPIIWLTFLLIGVPGVVLSIVVLIETYYPWKLLGEQRGLFLKSLQMMSNAVDLKDPYTAHHSRRVAESSVILARRLGVSEEEVARIRMGALMHDIGKIAVPGRIIRKPSKLTAEEMALMKGHVQEGASLIQGLEILQKAADIVKHHHENFDGSGYPDGLSGNSIPRGARIVFVADAFDALTTDRPYRKGRSRAEAIEVIEANASSQFDPEVVAVLREMPIATQP